MIFRGQLGIGIAVVLLATSGSSGTSPDQDRPAKANDNSPNEPLARKFSTARASEFLDRSAMAWLDKHHCAACHTSYPYLMAGPSLAEKPTAGQVRMRKYLEDRAARWDSGEAADRPEPGSEGITEIVATATTLAFHDAQTTGKLHPLTRKALDTMWTVQRPDGSWDWNKHRLPPLEYDDYFGAVFAALGVNVAPEGYAQTEQARVGLTKLRSYFTNHPAPDLHHKTWLLWASLRLDGLMTAAERDGTIRDLLALQHEDGGWSLPSLGKWQRHDGTPNDPAASDGYATGLILYVLRQTGLPATAKPLERGVAWLKSHQRASGSWFTRSLHADRAQYMTNAGTAFAVMALRACAVSEK